MLQGHSGNVTSIAFNYNWTILASVYEDKIIKIWNLATKTEIVTLLGHNNRIISVAFKKDESILVSASEDNMIKLWNLETKSN